MRDRAAVELWLKRLPADQVFMVCLFIKADFKNWSESQARVSRPGIDHMIHMGGVNQIIRRSLLTQVDRIRFTALTLLTFTNEKYFEL